MTRYLRTASSRPCLVVALLVALGASAASCSQSDRASSQPPAAAGSAGQEQAGSAGEAGSGDGGEAGNTTDAGDEGDAAAEADVPDGPCIPPDAPLPAPPMIEVPAGEFMMGCNAALDSSCEPSEMPYHKVSLSAFRLDKHEVTMAEYKACVDNCVCSIPHEGFDPAALPDNPVVSVTLEQAGTYCTWLGRRVPSEAEWEKGARGTDGRIYPWGNEAPGCDHAAFLTCAWDGKAGVTLPVGTFSPKGDSPYGAQDMAGNVWEWVSDWYGPYDGDAASDPEGPSSGAVRLWRGGSYLHGPSFLRTSGRFPYAVAYYHALGIRCAQSL